VRVKILHTAELGHKHTKFHWNRMPSDRHRTDKNGTCSSQQIN